MPKHDERGTGGGVAVPGALLATGEEIAPAAPAGPAAPAPALGEALESGVPDEAYSDLADMFGFDEDVPRQRPGGPREKTRGANRGDRRQVDNAATAAGVTDRRGFGKFIEAEKAATGRGASENYTYEELEQLAREFAEKGTT